MHSFTIVSDKIFEAVVVFEVFDSMFQCFLFFLVVILTFFVTFLYQLMQLIRDMELFVVDERRYNFTNLATN